MEVKAGPSQGKDEKMLWIFERRIRRRIMAQLMKMVYEYQEITTNFANYIMNQT
jgi:hypothetical protein